MRKINIPFSPPDMSEEEIKEVIDTLKSGWITTGPKVKEFEREIAEYCHTSKAVCLNSATACMEMTLRLLGIGPGDEVITSAYTYTASCSVICHVGATPVLVDVKKDSFEMDYDQLADKITDKTKAIIPVEVADFTSFSFHAVKNLTTAEGGAVVWKDIKGIDNEWIYKQYQLLSLHGQTKDALNKTKLGAWEYDIMLPAYKCNMTDIMGGIGLAQLKRYPKLLARRKEIIDKYNEGFKGLNIQVLNHYNETHQSSGHLYLTRINGITLEQRNKIIELMAEKGIACNVHYKPLPMLTAYENLGFDIADYPNAYNQFINEITLPLHTKLTDEEVEYVIDWFKEVVK